MNLPLAPLIATAKIILVTPFQISGKFQKFYAERKTKEQHSSVSLMPSPLSGAKPDSSFSDRVHNHENGQSQTEF
jgi:hypothetical protein